LEGNFEDHLIQAPCHEQGHLSLDEVAQSPIQIAYGHHIAKKVITKKWHWIRNHACPGLVPLKKEVPDHCQICSATPQLLFNFKMLPHKAQEQ